VVDKLDDVLVWILNIKGTRAVSVGLWLFEDGHFMRFKMVIPKINIARRFQDNTTNPDDNRITRTNTYQSIVEQVALPGAYDGKKIERSFENGVMTIKVPKVSFGPAKEKS
jgi:hypothetical protein